MSKSWHSRGLTSLFTLAGFLIMSVTGLVLYVVPQGRIAYWTDWTLWGMSKTQWGDIHILSSILFVIAGAFHIALNWKPLIGYLRKKLEARMLLRREASLAAILSVWVIASGIWHIPPLRYLLDLNQFVKESWIEGKDSEPPFGHAELVSLKVLCKKSDIPLGEALSALQSHGLKGVDPDRIFLDLATENQLSPMETFRMISHLGLPRKRPAVFTADSVEERFAGTGIGSRTLQDMCAELGLEFSRIRERLASKGISVEGQRSLKAVASRHGLAPIDLLKAALVKAYLPPKPG